MNQNRENVRVAIRFRPLSTKEQKKQQGNNDCRFFIESNQVRIARTIFQSQTTTTKNHDFFYDHVFDHTTTQSELFETVAKSILISALNGYNATIFAYGPTGTGKTYTMFGVKSNEGIIPRAGRLIFNYLDTSDSTLNYEVKCSFVQIYREKIYDLLSSNVSEDLFLRQNKSGEVSVFGAEESDISNHTDILQTIHRGETNRISAATALNDHSSRSHAVLILNIRRNLVDGTMCTSKVFLIDLAGSENVSRSEVSGVNLSEAQTINKSLSCLGNVINALTSNHSHIPYRDSKLTFLLQNSLGGNSRTLLLCTATPFVTNQSETINTLKFASRAKKIRNDPRINKKESTTNLKLENESLKKLINRLRDKIGGLERIIDTVAEPTSDNLLFRSLTTRLSFARQENDYTFNRLTDEEKQNDQYRQTINDLQSKLNSSRQEILELRARNSILNSRLDDFVLFYLGVATSKLWIRYGEVNERLTIAVIGIIFVLIAAVLFYILTPRCIKQNYTHNDAQRESSASADTGKYATMGQYPGSTFEITPAARCRGGPYFWGGELSFCNDMASSAEGQTAISLFNCPKGYDGIPMVPFTYTSQSNDAWKNERCQNNPTCDVSYTGLCRMGSQTF